MSDGGPPTEALAAELAAFDAELDALPDGGSGVAPALVAELYGDGGERAFARSAGVNRSAVRSLVKGDGCSLANLAALSEAHPALVVYVGGVPYRLQRAEGMPLAPALREEMERGARDGLEVLRPPRHVQQIADGDCTGCRAVIPEGEQALVTVLRGPAGFETERLCPFCDPHGLAGVNPEAGTAAWLDSVGGKADG